MYKFVEHTADAAITVTANSYEKLFSDFAFGLKELSFKVKSKSNLKIKRIKLSSYSLEELLVKFLDELNYSLLVKKLFFEDINSILIKNFENNFYLQAELGMNKINSTNCELKKEIKAVTFHKLKIKKVKNNFRATIIFDI